MERFRATQASCVGHSSHAVCQMLTDQGGCWDSCPLTQQRLGRHVPVCQGPRQVGNSAGSGHAHVCAGESRVSTAGLGGHALVGRVAHSGWQQRQDVLYGLQGQPGQPLVILLHDGAESWL